MSEPLHRNRERAESFGVIAAQYDRARPAYPEALVHDLLMADPHDVLDVGCGTGKAGRLLAERGLHVLGVEIDPGMAEVARTHGLEVEVSGFEGWDARGRTFDLLICAQAWHWIDHAVGSRKAREVLRPGGRVALIWNRADPGEDVLQLFDPVYLRYAPGNYRGGGRTGADAGRREDVLDALRDAGLVGVSTADYDWQRVYSRDEYLDLLGTYSDHHLLAPGARTALLAGIGEVIDSLGGRITVGYGTHVVRAEAP